MNIYDIQARYGFRRIPNFSARCCPMLLASAERLETAEDADQVRDRLRVIRSGRVRERATADEFASLANEEASLQRLLSSWEAGERAKNPLYALPPKPGMEPAPSVPSTVATPIAEPSDPLAKEWAAMSESDRNSWFNDIEVYREGSRMKAADKSRRKS